MSQALPGPRLCQALRSPAFLSQVQVKPVPGDAPVAVKASSDPTESPRPAPAAAASPKEARHAR